MDDNSIMGRIQVLVDEESALREREAGDAVDEQALERDRERLQEVSVELDRCWDLLRQRRALRETGGDPDQAEARDAATVEKYLQ
jgi:hypothetical protein